MILRAVTRQIIAKLLLQKINEFSRVSPTRSLKDARRAELGPFERSEPKSL